MSSEEKLKSDLKEKIWKAQINKNHAKLLQCVSMARHNRIELDAKDYNAALWACTQISDDRNLEAYWIYALLKKHSPVPPMSVFHSVLKVCLVRCDPTMALQVVKDYESLGYDLTEDLMCDLLSCLSHSKSGGASSDLLHFYSAFRKFCREKGWQGTPEMYMDVLQGHIRQANAPNVLEVLRDMTESNFEPSLELCYSLLGLAMFHSDAKTLLFLAQQFGDKFPVVLEYGTCCRLLQVAAVTGEPKLGQVALQLMSKSGHVPSIGDYACWVRACVAGNDFVGSVEALMEAHEQGLDFLADDDDQCGGGGGGAELSEAMAYSLSRSVRRLDDTYFALVELVRGNLAVPPMTLNAVIMAAGRMGQIDRSFATFKEYKSLFNLDVDVHAYNALLFACSSFRDSNVGTLLSVLQDMDSAGISPNSVSFSILLQTMADCEDLTSLGPVADATVALGLRLRPRALRCVAVTAAKQGDWACVERVRTMLASQDVPSLKFFSARLEQIRAAQGANVTMNA